MACSTFSFAVSGSFQADIPVEKTATLENFSKENLEQTLGRKLNFLEKFTLKIIQKKIKKRQAKAGNEGEKDRKMAVSALALGVGSLVFLIGGLTLFFAGLIAGPWMIGLAGITALPAIVTGALAKDGSKSRTDKFAKIGMGLGIGTLGFGVLFLILVLAILASISI